jgi:nucleotide-binding universal stress UspA family protein
MAKTWLVPLDGSNNAEWALQSTMDMMNAQNDTLHVLSVCQTSAMKNLLGMQDASKGDTEAFHRKLVDQYVNMAKQFGITNVVGNVDCGGHIGDVICRYIADNGVDVVVIGSKGLGGLGKLVFGSTSRYVFENANADTIIVRNKYSKEQQQSAKKDQDEVHANKEEIIKLEEKERKRRMSDRQEQEDRFRMATSLSQRLKQKLEQPFGGHEEKRELGNIPIEQGQGWQGEKQGQEWQGERQGQGWQGEKQGQEWQGEREGQGWQGESQGFQGGQEGLTNLFKAEGEPGRLVSEGEPRKLTE